MGPKKNIVVVGGGPAGIEAAVTAVTNGGRVILVSDGPVGGRADWHSMLPSKAWIRRVHAARSRPDETDFDSVRVDFVETARSWHRQQSRQLSELEVVLVEGRGSLISDHRVTVKGDGQAEEYDADAIIIATGAVPAFPPGLEPDGSRVIAPHLMADVSELSREIAVIGDGPPAIEYVDVFNRLGLQVSWMVSPYFPMATTEFLIDSLKTRGVAVFMGSLVTSLERSADHVTLIMDDGARHDAGMVFVSIGAKPDVQSLGLSAADIDVAANGTVTVNEYLQTSASSVYIVGDALGQGAVSVARAQARVAALHAMNAVVEPFRRDCVVVGIYSQPQWATVGTVNEAGLTSVTVSYAEGLIGHLLPDEAGQIELFYDGDGLIRGAVAVGADANNLLAPIAVAIRMNGSVQDLASVYGAHPTVSELAFVAARKAAQG